MGSGRRRKSPPPEEMEEETPLSTWWRASVPAGAGTLATALLALLVRLLVSLGPYSGRGRPPMYGDYEAQRHWMEITLHTPPSEWYRNTSANDLAYWGLDYPPLTAYQSYAHGRLFLQPFAPDSVALLSSRGHETPRSKLLMRWTVLSSDLLVFFPAALYFVYVYCCRQKRGCEGDGVEWQWLLAMILLNPCLILIDHGHFQVCACFVHVHIALIHLYACAGISVDATKLFDEMPEPDVISWSGLLTAQLTASDIEAARPIFDRMPVHDVVSWTAMIAGYAQGGLPRRALALFRAMPSKVVSRRGHHGRSCVQGDAVKGEALMDILAEMPKFPERQSALLKKAEDTEIDTAEQSAIKIRAQRQTSNALVVVTDQRPANGTLPASQG